MYGILRQNERLDAGEPTEVVRITDRKTLESIEALSAALGEALMARQVDPGNSESSPPILVAAKS